MKASLSQLLAAFLILSSLCGTLASFSSGPIVWNNRNLPYAIPELPQQFEENGREPPYFIIGTFSPATQFDSGRQMYLLEHRFGWHLCREQFYRTGKFRDWDDISIDSLDSAKWNMDHMLFARANGYLQCKTQIEHLIEANAPDSPRNKLGYSNLWRVAPAIALGVLGVTMMVRLNRHATAV